MSDIEIKNIVANFISAKKNLKKLAPDFNWGSLLGDYGELVAIKHYGWEQAPTGKKGYDAINKQKKTIQIKTVYSTNQIKFKKGTKTQPLQGPKNRRKTEKSRSDDPLETHSKKDPQKG